MDLTSVTITLVLLIIFGVPFIYSLAVQKREKKNFSKELINLAEQQHVKFSQYEIWNHFYGIGIDTATSRLFYFKQLDGKEEKAFIDFSEVKRCSVNNVHRTVNHSRVTDRLELVFRFHDPTLPEKRLEFYNRDESLSLDNEVQLVEKWAAIINSNLKARVNVPLIRNASDTKN